MAIGAATFAVAFRLSLSLLYRTVHHAGNVVEAIAGLPVWLRLLAPLAATTAASVHAPLTAAVMIFELSGDYPIVLPLLVATVVSTSVSRRLGSESVYETEFRRRGLGWELALEGRRLKVRGQTTSAADE